MRRPDPAATNATSLETAAGTSGDASPPRARAVSTSRAASTSLSVSEPLERLIETAQDYARQAASENTQRAYQGDWTHFTRWCRARGVEPLPPDPELVGLYLADLPTTLSVGSIERRLSGIIWHITQRGMQIDRRDRHIASILAGIKRRHGRPPRQKEALSVDDLQVLLATLPHDLRGIRDRAILLIGYAGGLRRSEIVGLDVKREDTSGGTSDGLGWIDILEPGAVVTLKGKTGWREVEIGRGSSPATCPVHALEQWLRFAQLDFGAVFVRTSRDGAQALPERRLSDRHVARLIKSCVTKSNLRADLPDAERLALFSGHSLRAGLATSAEVDERFVQKQLGHSSVEMTRRYQRKRDRFRINLSKAVGL